MMTTPEPPTSGRRGDARLASLYEITGEVVHGNHLGRTIGFPTANIEFPGAQVAPPFGAYAGEVRIQDGVFAAAVNVGVRPTLTTGEKFVVEAHLLDFDGDLYGQQITIYLRMHLRTEQRFASVNDLIARLHLDVAATAKFSRQRQRA